MLPNDKIAANFAARRAWGIHDIIQFHRVELTRKPSNVLEDFASFQILSQHCLRAQVYILDLRIDGGLRCRTAVQSPDRIGLDYWIVQVPCFGLLQAVDPDTIGIYDGIQWYSPDSGIFPRNGDVWEVHGGEVEQPGLTDRSTDCSSSADLSSVSSEDQATEEGASLLQVTWILQSLMMSPREIMSQPGPEVEFQGRPALEDLQLVYSFRLGSQFRYDYYDCSSFVGVQRQLSDSWQVPFQQVHNFFELNSIPEDLEVVGANGVIVWIGNEWAPFDGRSLVLTDVCVHESKSTQHKTSVFRQVQAVPTPLHREYLLHVLQIDQYCRLQNSRCLIWKNAELWPTQRPVQHIHNGDYLKVAIPPFEQVSAVSTVMLLQGRLQDLSQSYGLCQRTSKKGSAGKPSAITGRRIGHTHERVEGCSGFALATLRHPFRPVSGMSGDLFSMMPGNRPVTLRATQPVVSYRLGARYRAGNYDCSTYYGLQEQLAVSWEVDFTQMLAFFEVEPTPPDIHETGANAVAVWIDYDLPYPESMRLALVDVEVHEDTATRSPTTTLREVFALPSTLHRDHLLQQLALHRYCRLVDSRCLVWHGAQLWPSQDPVRYIRQGHYLKVAVPPLEKTQQSTMQQVLTGVRPELLQQLGLVFSANSASRQAIQTVDAVTGRPIGTQYRNASSSAAECTGLVLATIPRSDCGQIVDIDDTIFMQLTAAGRPGSSSDPRPPTSSADLHPDPQPVQVEESPCDIPAQIAFCNEEMLRDWIHHKQFYDAPPFPVVMHGLKGDPLGYRRATLSQADLDGMRALVHQYWSEAKGCHVDIFVVRPQPQDERGHLQLILEITSSLIRRPEWKQPVLKLTKNLATAVQQRHAQYHSVRPILNEILDGHLNDCMPTGRILCAVWAQGVSFQSLRRRLLLAGVLVEVTMTKLSRVEDALAPFGTATAVRRFFLQVVPASSLDRVWWRIHLYGSDGSIQTSIHQPVANQALDPGLITQFITEFFTAMPSTCAALLVETPDFSVLHVMAGNFYGQQPVIVSVFDMELHTEHFFPAICPSMVVWTDLEALVPNELLPPDRHRLHPHIGNEFFPEEMEAYVFPGAMIRAHIETLQFPSVAASLDTDLGAGVGSDMSTMLQIRQSVRGPAFKKSPRTGLRPPGNGPEELEEFDLTQMDHVLASDEAPDAGCRQPELYHIGSDDDSDGEDVQIEVSGHLQAPGDFTSLLPLSQPWPVEYIRLEFEEVLELPAHVRAFLETCNSHDSFTSASAVYLYTDGSCDPGTGLSAYSVVILTDCKSDASDTSTRSFAGYFGGLVQTSDTSSDWVGASQHTAAEAECSAQIWAMLWYCQAGLQCPCYLCFDNQRVGFAGSGRWKTDQNWKQLVNYRSIMHFAEAVYGPLFIHERVKAHSNQPMNDLADVLANHFRDSKTSQQGKFEWIHDILATKTDVLSWGWYWAESLMHTLHLPLAHADTEAALSWTLHDHPGVQAVMQDLECQSNQQQITTKCALQVMTYNVRSLQKSKTGPDATDFEIYNEKASFLKEQVAALGIHVVGLQETRVSAKASFRSSDFLRITSGADPPYNLYGCELWFNLRQPWCSTDDLKSTIDPSGVTILFSSPRCLAARLQSNGQSLVFISLHAPHEGVASEDKDRWWQQLRDGLGKWQKLGSCILLGDFNARLGDSIDSIVGDRGVGETNDNGHRMQTLMKEFDLWAPSTFSDYHTTGDDTWQHARGQSARLDYVVISQAWKLESVSSRVLYAIDIGNLGFDNLPVALWTCWASDKNVSRKSLPKVDWDFLRTEQGQRQLSQLVSNLPDLPWNLDARTHWDILQTLLQQQLPRQFPGKSIPRRKSFLQNMTWELFAKRKQLRRFLQICDHHFAQLELSESLDIWRYSLPPRIPVKKHFLDLCSLVLLRLQILQTFRSNAKELKRQVQKDKADWVNGLADDISQGTTVEMYNNLKLLRIGGRFRKRPLQPHPSVHDDNHTVCQGFLERDLVWQKHCARLEAGVPTTTKRLLHRACKGSFGRAVKFSRRRLQEAPTLQALETCFRRVKPDKAQGNDDLSSTLCTLAAPALAKKFFPLLCKLVFTYQEPLQCKGGTLIAAYKGAGSQLEVDSYRSLLLSSHIGKSLRRSVREQMIECYTSNAADLHVNIRPGGSVSHASHAMRLLYYRGCIRRKLNAGILFLDIRSAFYRVVRQLAANSTFSDEGVARLFQYFDINSRDMHHLMAELQHESVTSRGGTPAEQEALLEELLASTWFTTPQRRQVMETLAGSRPGDGLADLVFGFVFQRILERVTTHIREFFQIEAGFVCTKPSDFNEQWLEQHAYLPAIADVVWADDLALLLHAPNADSLIDRLTMSACELFKICLRHGMQPNTKRGKTEAMVHLSCVTMEARGVLLLKQSFTTSRHVFLQYTGVFCEPRSRLAIMVQRSSPWSHWFTAPTNFAA